MNTALETLEEQAKRIRSLRDNTLAILQNDVDEEYAFLSLYCDQLNSIYDELHKLIENRND